MMNNSDNIKQLVEKLSSDREQTGDVTFIVESERIRVHRNVLAALSPKYEAQFYGPNPHEDEIHIPNTSAAAFKEFLQFFYKETVDLTTENIETVLDLSNQSLNDEFIAICIDFLKKSVAANNFCLAYHLAIFYGIESLRRDCEQQISTRAADFFVSDDFLHCDRDMLLHILKLNSLKCPESTVFNACIAWARADCEQNGLDKKGPENLRRALGDVIYEIRFSSLTTEEFAALQKRESLEGFFKADELIELLYITTKQKEFTPRMFNLTPRNQPEFRMKVLTGPKTWSLECNRFQRLKKCPVKIHQVCFQFDCDKPIRLHGIVLSINLEDVALGDFPEKIRASVKFDGNPCVQLEIECDLYTMSQNNIIKKNESVILFKKPIERLTGFFISLEFPSLELNYELVLKDEVEVDNVEFTLAGGWITRLLFDKLDHSERGRQLPVPL